ncbi:MAG: oxidoreductase-like domain-containing protein [Burkholderiaceae bacterium]
MPEPTSCCARGYHGCVWKGYFAAVEYWRDEALLRLEAGSPLSASGDLPQIPGTQVRGALA